MENALSTESRLPSQTSNSNHEANQFKLEKVNNVVVTISPHETTVEQQGNICRFCNKKLKTRKALADHIQTQHFNPKMSLYKCETCGKEMKSKHSLGIHQVKHSDERPVSCNLCKISYKSQFYLDRHRKSKGHKFVESTLKLMEETPISEMASITREVNDGKYSAETLSKMGTQSQSKLKVDRSPFLASTPTSTSKLGSESSASIGSSSQQQVTNTAPINIFNRESSSMRLPMQAVPNFVLSHNGAVPFENTNTIQPSGTNFVLCSGNQDFMVPQQMIFRTIQSQVFPGQNQQILMLACSECQALFSVAAHLRSHMKEYHQDKCWKCPACFDIMLSPAEFEQHYNQCNNERK